MRTSPRDRALLARSLVASVCGLALIGTVATSAAADREPTPSADQVAAAQSAVATAAVSAQSIDAQLAAARDAVAQTRLEAADAEMASHGADELLAQASQKAAAARGAADQARQAADSASFQLSLLAAEAYQQGAGLVQLDALLGADGPQDALDRAAGLEAVAAERVHAAADADSARLLAATLDRAATEAEQRRITSAAAARAAADDARRDAAQLADRLATLQSQSAELTAQLATLRQTSVAVEQARQDGLAAQEQARRDEEARQAGIRAAADAARQEADRLAAQQATQLAQAQADQRAATTARQAAAAATAAATARAAAAAQGTGITAGGRAGAETAGSGRASPETAQPADHTGHPAARVGQAAAQPRHGRHVGPHRLVRVRSAVAPQPRQRLLRRAAVQHGRVAHRGRLRLRASTGPRLPRGADHRSEPALRHARPPTLDLPHGRLRVTPAAAAARRAAGRAGCTSRPVGPRRR